MTQQQESWLKCCPQWLRRQILYELIAIGNEEGNAIVVMFWFLLVDFDKAFVRNKVTKELAGFQAGINGKCEA